MQPLAPDGKLTIGGSDEDSLMFEQWKSDPGPALTYLKIFVTKGCTSFSFLTQDGSPTKDKFRGLPPPLKLITPSIIYSCRSWPKGDSIFQ